MEIHVVENYLRIYILPMKDIQNEFVLSVPAGCIEQQSNAENRT
jgi:hypothetical protein